LYIDVHGIVKNTYRTLMVIGHVG